MDKKDSDRFWKYVEILGEDDCWEWKRSKSDGYGFFGVGGRTFHAQRIAWIATNGEIPHDGSFHGICVLHKCDNRGCCNPKHLFLGTQNDNMKDMARKKRGNSDAQKKLSVEQVREIKSLLMAPKRNRLSLRNIAKQYSVSHNTIWQIAHNISWKNV